jgi:hypothetical protein
MYAGIGPDMAINTGGLHLIRGDGLQSTHTQEIIYNGSSDRGVSWYGPTIISEIDYFDSFWPQITAWGNSNIVVTWTDYKNSQEAWSGDVFYSKSTNNGQTWSPPDSLTYSHMVTGTNVASSGDTILVAYDDAKSGVDVIYTNTSFDGGLTWEGESRMVGRVSEAKRRNPTLLLGNNQ